MLGRALGRSVDDAALTVHLVLQQMISLNGGQTGTNLYSLKIFLLLLFFFNGNNFFKFFFNFYFFVYIL